jgi:hypothetical protein
MAVGRKKSERRWRREEIRSIDHEGVQGDVDSKTGEEKQEREEIRSVDRE